MKDRYLGFDATDQKDNYIFLSYSSIDSNEVRPIAKLLDEKLSIPIWYDQGIKSRQDFNKTISQRIKNCNEVIMFISNHNLTDPDSYVFYEYVLAHRRNHKPIHYILLEEINENNIQEEYDNWWTDINYKYQHIPAYNMSNEDVVDKIINSLTPSHNSTLEKKKKEDYLILEDTELERLSKFPSGFVIIHLYTCVLKDREGNLFIPMEYPHYGGIWTVPHISYDIDLPRHRRLRKVKDILEFIDKNAEENDTILEELKYQKLYQMGLFQEIVEKSDSYTEYKVSPTYKDRVQCYRVEEYFFTDIDESELKNIYDPEHLKGYKYFPLTKNYDIDFNSKYVKKIDDTVYFFDKPLSSNIINLIKNKKELRAATFKVPVILTPNGTKN